MLYDERNYDNDSRLGSMPFYGIWYNFSGSIEKFSGSKQFFQGRGNISWPVGYRIASPPTWL